MSQHLIVPARVIGEQGSIFLTSLEMTMTIEISKMSPLMEESMQDEVKCLFTNNPDHRRSTIAYLILIQEKHMST